MAQMYQYASSNLGVRTSFFVLPSASDARVVPAGIDTTVAITKEKLEEIRGRNVRLFKLLAMSTSDQ